MGSASSVKLLRRLVRHRALLVGLGVDDDGLDQALVDMLQDFLVGVLDGPEFHRLRLGEAQVRRNHKLLVRLDVFAKDLHVRRPFEATGNSGGRAGREHR